MTLAILSAFVTVARGQAPTFSPTPAPTRTYSGGIGGNCQRIGHGPVIKSSPGTIITIHAGGEPLGDGVWLLIFNKTTPPVNGDVPVIAFSYSGGLDRDYPGGLPMTTGISWALSHSPVVLAATCDDVTLTITYQ